MELNFQWHGTQIYFVVISNLLLFTCNEFVAIVFFQWDTILFDGKDRLMRNRSHCERK